MNNVLGFMVMKFGFHLFCFRQKSERFNMIRIKTYRKRGTHKQTGG